MTSLSALKSAQVDLGETSPFHAATLEAMIPPSVLLCPEVKMLNDFAKTVPSSAGSESGKRRLLAELLE